MQEKQTIIVNEKDEIIWYKYRKDIKSEDIYRVSALVIRNSKQEFLLAQRSFNKKNDPWVWSLSVAWTIEKGETYDENIIHEIKEEIGIKNINLEKIDKLRIYGKHNFFCQFFKAKLDLEIEDFIIEEKEIVQIRWFSKDEIKKWIFDWNIISKTLIDNLNIF